MKRVTLFAGHYGSGKTNIALNYARHLRRSLPGRRIVLGDLDIVNPYFRTKDSVADLRRDGIELVVSDYANSNVDFPALPKEIYSLTAPGDDAVVVLDIGGDDRGALALGRYVPDLQASGDYEMLAVVNAARPLTRTPADTVEVLREIEAACRLPFTGLVNNTNIGPETTAAVVLGSLAYADEVARILSIPVTLTCALARLRPDLEGQVENLFPIDIQKLYYQLDAGAQ